MNGWDVFLRGQDCGINDNGHRYAYAITMDTDDGHTRAGKFVDHSIQAFRDSGVYSSTGWHKLRIEAMGNHLRFLIDDQLFYEATDTDYTHGQYGFSHQEVGTRNTYYYNRVDNFRAGSLPEIQDEPGIVIWQSY